MLNVYRNKKGRNHVITIGYHDCHPGTVGGRAEISLKTVMADNSLPPTSHESVYIVWMDW